MPTESQSRTDAAPAGALTRAGLRRVLITLCATEIVSWGVLYYAFPVLATEISTDTGWSKTLITAPFSAGLLVAALIGIPVGRWLDRYGPRWIMTAGSALAAPSVVVIAIAPNLPLFFAGWLLAGVAMSAVLYPPAFAAVTRWFGAQRVKALTLLTLAAGLASTVFAPLTAFIMGHLDWRGTYLVLAAVLAVVTVPGHLWGLRGHWPAVTVARAAARPTATAQPAVASRSAADDDPVSDELRRDDPIHDDDPVREDPAHADPPQEDPAHADPPQEDPAHADPPQEDPAHEDPARITRSVAFVALMFALGLSSFTAFAVVINLVPLLVEQGISVSTAALALGLGGAGQVVGRMGYPALVRHVDVRLRTTLILLATALTTVLLSVLTSATTLIAAAIVAGMARGLHTLVQATAVSDRWGNTHYGRLTGVLSAPITITIALAPWAGAALADLLGSYAAAFVLLAVLGLIGAGFALISSPRTKPQRPPSA